MKAFYERFIPDENKKSFLFNSHTFTDECMYPYTNILSQNLWFSAISLQFEQDFDIDLYRFS